MTLQLCWKSSLDLEERWNVKIDCSVLHENGLWFDRTPWTQIVVCKPETHNRTIVIAIISYVRPWSCITWCTSMAVKKGKLHEGHLVSCMTILYYMFANHQISHQAISKVDRESCRFRWPLWIFLKSLFDFVWIHILTLSPKRFSMDQCCKYLSPSAIANNF